MPLKRTIQLLLVAVVTAATDEHENNSLARAIASFLLTHPTPAKYKNGHSASLQVSADGGGFGDVLNIVAQQTLDAITVGCG